MYLKLAVRNAKRSAKDYMLYLATMIVLSSLIMFSNFQTCRCGMPSYVVHAFRHKQFINLLK